MKYKYYDSLRMNTVILTDLVEKKYEILNLEANNESDSPSSSLKIKPLHFSKSFFAVYEADYHLLFPLSSDVSKILLQISSTLCEHYKLWKVGLSDNNCNVAIHINDSGLLRYKPSDPETNLARLIYICSLFEHRSDFSFSFGIFRNNNIQNYSSPEVGTGFWPFTNRWKGDEDVILLRGTDSETYHNITMNDELSAPWTKNYRNTSGQFYKKYLTYAEDNNYQVSYFDYSCKFESIIDKMIHSKMVVSDFSGLTCLALFVGVPTVLITENDLTSLSFRPVTWGGGNITMGNMISQHNNEQFVQSVLEAPIYNSTPDSLLIPNEIKSR